MIKERSIFYNVLSYPCALLSLVSEKPDFIFKYRLYSVVKLCCMLVSVACAAKRTGKRTIHHFSCLEKGNVLQG